MQRKKQYPVKTIVNLVQEERPVYPASRLLCLAVILAALVAGFCKFAVLERLEAASRAEEAASAAQSRLEQMRENTVDYERVCAEYARYFSEDWTQTACADCMEVLELLESKLMSRAGVSSAVFQENLLSLQLTGIDLEGASSLIGELCQSPLVDRVEIDTADAQSTTAVGVSSSIAMTITLRTEEKEAGS